jgi:hypothetical protein
LTAIKDMTRLRFGCLTVLRRAGSDARGKAKWACRCDCGNRTVVSGRSLRSGKTISCGCRGSRTGTMNIKHGHTRHYQQSPEYRAWAILVARCSRSTHGAFRWYGGAGIKVCKRWRNSFAAFLADMGSKPDPHFVLARIHKDRDYTPSNCEWSPDKPLKRQVATRQSHRRGITDARRR